MLQHYGAFPGLEGATSAKHFLTRYGVQISLGEMIAYLPLPGGHIRLAERFVDPAFSFALGWNYWYNWTIGLPAELTAAAVLMQFWKSVSFEATLSVTNTFLQKYSPSLMM